MPSSFHFAKKPSKGIEAVWKSYLTQTIACREQLDESMTEASVFSDEMRERWPNSGEFKPNDPEPEPDPAEDEPEPDPEQNECDYPDAKRRRI